MTLCDRLLGNYHDLLSHTLAHADTAVALLSQNLPSGARASLLTTGVLHVQPPLPAERQLILSAGLHGDETAPIEVLNELASAILAGEIAVDVDLLLILGNPPAMVQGTRYVRHNLNRLFCGKHALLEDDPGPEGLRAAELEQWVQRFVEPGTPLWHYDLHTAIRASTREKFALYPFVAGRELPERQQALMQACEVDTLLLQHKPASTFSAFTAQRFGAESFTVELGRVAPFGHNDLSRLQALRHQLPLWLSATWHPPAQPQAPGPELFEVVHEILHTGEGFVLHVADDVANFTPFPPGTLIWEDPQTHYRVGDVPESIVFPNRDVPKGQRAGLMVRPKNP